MLANNPANSSPVTLLPLGISPTERFSAPHLFNAYSGACVQSKDADVAQPEINDSAPLWRS